MERNWPIIQDKLFLNDLLEMRLEAFYFQSIESDDSLIGIEDTPSRSLVKTTLEHSDDEPKGDVFIFQNGKTS